MICSTTLTSADIIFTFMIISGGMQWVSSSYNLERISNSLQSKNKYR